MYMGRAAGDTKDFNLSDNSVLTVAEVDLVRYTSLRGIQFAVFNEYEGVETTNIKCKIYVQILPKGRWVPIGSINPLGIRDMGIPDTPDVGNNEVFSGCLDEISICGFRVDVQRTAGTEPVPGAVEWQAMDSKQGF